VCVCVRALVGMVMYSNETKEIAKPSELLNSIKAIMNVLQSIENYGMTSYCIVISGWSGDIATVSLLVMGPN